jgi:3'(2'), 5'-bisphosphate nucleotidase
VSGEEATPDDHRLAAVIAERAGAALLELRAAGAYDVGARGDRLADDLILAALASDRPEDPVLSEESKDDRRRLESRRAWIVDPLDGTREFGEAGRTDWAVHVALCIDGRPLVGAVALPAQGQTLSTAEPSRLPEPAADGRLRIVVSRSRPPAWVSALASDLDAELVPMGSAGAKTCAVVLGQVDAYVHGGGQFEWDSAAPIAVALAAGAHASRLDGSPLVYNKPDPRQPDLLVCRPELAARFLAALQTHTQL